MDIKKKVKEFLFELISIPSTRGKEGPAIQLIYNEIKSLVDECELVKVDDSIMDDSDYAFKLENFTYKNTPELECRIKGSSNGKSVVFNAHVDVVPPSAGQKDPFIPTLKNGIIFGRGACDDKGQVAALFSLILLLKEKGIKPKGDIIFHFVVEEENGGNGTLAMIRRGIKADAAVVMESSEMNVVTAVRGAVWFKVEVFGKAGHSGQSRGNVSAIKKAFQAMQILEAYHDEVLKESREVPLFDEYENPMPITFGQFNAGDWPATVPARAVFKGVFGFLPNKNRFEIQKGIKKSIQEKGDAWLKNNCRISFPMLNSDGNVISTEHPLVLSLQKAIKKNGYPGKVKAMTASSDAWLYNNQAKIPTIIFGAGSIKYAHSNFEQIALKEILDAGVILKDFLGEFC